MADIRRLAGEKGEVHGTAMILVWEDRRKFLMFKSTDACTIPDINDMHMFCFFNLLFFFN